MGRAVKKAPNVANTIDYEAKFAAVRIAADAFERQDQKGRGLLRSALARIFEFGEEIRQDEPAFEAFLAARGFKLNKTTRVNPYNALVARAFSDACGKSWRSEMSTVLHYAAENKGKQPIVDWLHEKSISERYDEAVKFFARTSATKAQSLKSARLDMITRELTGARVVEQALSGLTLPEGFHRSLIFSDGGQSFLVHINDDDDGESINKYLLELAGKRTPRVHPLAEKMLYPLFRAVDFITSTCSASNAAKVQLIVLWNEKSDTGRVTKVKYVSDAYNFTHATVTLASAIPLLDGQGQVALEMSDALVFVERFQHDFEWSFALDKGRLFAIDTAPAVTRIEFKPITRFAGVKLWQGGKLGRKTRHFRATCEGMKAATSNLTMANELFKKGNLKRLTKAPAPKRLYWLRKGDTLEAGFCDDAGYSKFAYPFLEFPGPVEEIHAERELSLADMSALWAVGARYGEDLAGFIGDSDVADAAFCIDHVYNNGDRVEYVSPMVLGVSMSRPRVCQDFVAVNFDGIRTPDDKKFARRTF